MLTHTIGLTVTGQSDGETDGCTYEYTRTTKTQSLAVDPDLHVFHGELAVCKPVTMQFL